MNIEGPVNQWSLDSLKRNKGLFTKTLNNTIAKRDKLKEQLKKESDAVIFYTEILKNIDEDIIELEKELKKNKQK